MKNPIAPSFKTEWFAIFLIILSLVAAAFFCPLFAGGLPVHFNDLGQADYSLPSWLVCGFWPVLISLVYLMFLFFPYLKINREESARLKEDWHKSKDLALSFLFIAQVISSLILSGSDGALVWALPILLLLLVVAFRPTFVRVLRERHGSAGQD